MRYDPKNYFILSHGSIFKYLDRPFGFSLLTKVAFAFVFFQFCSGWPYRQYEFCFPWYFHKALHFYSPNICLKFLILARLEENFSNVNFRYTYTHTHAKYEIAVTIWQCASNGEPNHCPRGNL